MSFKQINMIHFLENRFYRRKFRIKINTIYVPFKWYIYIYVERELPPPPKKKKKKKKKNMELDFGIEAQHV